MEGRLWDSISKTADTLALLETLLSQGEAFLFTDHGIRDVRHRAANVRAARSALQRAVESGRGRETELRRAIAAIDEANRLLEQVGAIEEAVAVVGGGSVPCAQEGGAALPENPGGRREQAGRGGRGRFTAPARAEGGAGERGLAEGVLGHHAAAVQPEGCEYGPDDGAAEAENRGLPRTGEVAQNEETIRERKARIRAELAGIIESQGGAIVFAGGAAGKGLRIGVRRGGFAGAGAAGRGFARAAVTKPNEGFVGARHLQEAVQHGGRAPTADRGQGRGFVSARNGGRGAAGECNPRERAARVLQELDVIIAGSTPAGRRSTRSGRRLLETTLEDYGFVVERVRRVPGTRTAAEEAGRTDRARPPSGEHQAASALGRVRADGDAVGEARAPVGQQAPRGEAPVETGFVTAADMVTDVQERFVHRGPNPLRAMDGGGDDGGSSDGSSGGDGGGRGPGGSSDGQENDEDSENGGLRIHKWERNVYALWSRAELETYGLRYTETSEVSDEGCGKETCVIAPRAGGEVGACYCPVPVGDEEGEHLNPVCQCDAQLRVPGGECRFSTSDQDLHPLNKLLVLGKGVVAGERMPQGTLAAVCKGRVMSEWEARQKINLPGHDEHIVFVKDDRGRVWAHDETEVGSVFCMVEHVPDEYHSNVVALKICGDRTRGWGDNCPPRLAMFTTDDIDPGFRLYWDKSDSGFDGFNTFSSEADSRRNGSDEGEEEGDASDNIQDVSTDVVMPDADVT